jgi:hypothetical protein
VRRHQGVSPLAQNNRNRTQSLYLPSDRVGTDKSDSGQDAGAENSRADGEGGVKRRGKAKIEPPPLTAGGIRQGRK